MTSAVEANIDGDSPLQIESSLSLICGAEMIVMITLKSFPGQFPVVPDVGVTVYVTF